MICSAQNVTVEEPEFIGQTLFLTSDSTAIALQKEYAGISTRVKGSSFIPYAGAFAGGVNMYLSVKGNTSPNTITATGSSVRFLVRVDNNDEDPEGVIRIMKFEQKKKERRVRYLESSLAGGVQTNESESYVSYYAKKYGENCYLISVPTSSFEKGAEYGLLASQFGAAGKVAQQAIITFSIR